MPLCRDAIPVADTPICVPSCALRHDAHPARPDMREHVRCVAHRLLFEPNPPGMTTIAQRDSDRELACIRPLTVRGVAMGSRPILPTGETLIS